ncbi:MAG: M20 family metallopeptidase [Anaerolineales bacterium]|nr:M20 family metallopeptidase [Anaerolineales bacterium]
MEGKRMANPLITIDPDEVIHFTQTIVRQSSVNGQESELGCFLADFLAENGLRVELDEVAPGRYNVLATLPGEDGEVGLLYHSHMDTVPVGAMVNPLSAEIQDGHIWGRGAVDQKGGLAASVMALAAIARTGIRLKSGLSLALVVDEESEHRGSMALVDKQIQARQAVITEPSDLRLVIGCKGTLPFQIRVEGKKAHGSRPWLGVNAIEQAMRVLQALDELEYPETIVRNYGAVRGSLNLGVIQGGQAYNIVPDECNLYFDRRTVPGDDHNAILSAVQAILDRLSQQELPVRSCLSVDRPDWHWDPIRQRGLLPAVTPEKASILDQVARQHQAVTGKAAELYFTDGYNEMDFTINDLHIPSVQYGPGDNRLCHTDEERLSISQLLDATQVYLNLALEIAGRN